MVLHITPTVATGKFLILIIQSLRLVFPFVMILIIESINSQTLVHFLLHCEKDSLSCTIKNTPLNTYQRKVSMFSGY